MRRSGPVVTDHFTAEERRLVRTILAEVCPNDVELPARGVRVSLAKVPTTTKLLGLAHGMYCAVCGALDGSSIAGGFFGLCFFVFSLIWLYIYIYILQAPIKSNRSERICS
jgi:hypothetical protein